MKKLFFTMAGEPADRLSQFSVKAQSKVSTLGMLMIIPMIMWFALGYSVSTTYLDANMPIGISVGILMSLLVLIMDRSIIQSTTIGWKAVAMRFVLAVIPALLNAVIVDMHIFSKDIQPLANEIRMGDYQKAFNEKNHLLMGEINELGLLIEEGRAHTEKLRGAYYAEMDGAGGSGKQGYGKIAAQKQETFKTSAAQLKEMEAKQEHLRRELDAQFKEGLAESLQDRAGVLTELNALLTFLGNNSGALMLYLAMFILMAGMELLPILYKSQSSHTDYDLWKDTESEAQKRRIRDLDEYHRRKQQRLTNLTPFDEMVEERVKKISA